MIALVTLVGVALILAAFYDIFRTLFQPSGKGVISKSVAHGLWRGFQQLTGRRRSLLALAGPSAFIASALTWGALLTLGWTCLYWTRMPESFSYSPGVNPAEHSGFFDALYLSLVTLGTLGYGDITPDGPVMRLLGPLQALVGFVLLTAIITWLLSIYPNLALQQSFAQNVTLLRDAEKKERIDLTGLNGNAVEQILGGLTSDLVMIGGNFTQFPITYYFHSADESDSLPVVMPYLLELAARASQDEFPAEVRLQAARLQGAIDALGETLAERFLNMSPDSPEQVFAAYARDHFYAD
jgi:hypothetical protein